MLWKPSSSSLRSPAPQVQGPRVSYAVDVMDTWAASLPIDLLLEIFLHLEAADVIRCAGVCKKWWRAIIDNASILGAHLDRFFGPSLLLGIFQYNTTASRLRRMSGPFQSALPSNGGGDTVSPTNSLMIPAAASVALSTLLWLKDGFILLRARSVNNLCLCNPKTGYYSIVPAVAAKPNKYILLTGSSSDDDYNPEVRILAVHRIRRESSTSFGAYEDTLLAYQLFSNSGHTAGMWGPVVQVSHDELQAGCLWAWMDRQTTAVGRDCVYWLAGPTRMVVTCVLALDVLTGRTWTVELPVQCRRIKTTELTSLILSMSSDGRLSLLESLCGPIIQVWVLSRDDTRWTCQRTIQIDVRSLLSHCPPWSYYRRTGIMPQVIQLSAFCPRSRCVIIIWSDQEFMVDIESASSHPCVRHIGYRNGHYCWPYEMDSSSTYISNMKHF